MRYVSKYFYSLLFGIILILYIGCAQFRGPKYPKIIYNNKQPLISVKYEYGEIQIILPLKYDELYLKIFYLKYMLKLIQRTR